jgi:hypothetical protein
MNGTNGGEMQKTDNRKRAVRELIEQARTLAAEYGDEVAAAVKAATEEPLEPVRARRLYTRVIKILRAAEGVDVEDDAAVAEQIRREVDAVVGSVQRPRVDGGGLTFIERNGLTPHEVKPIPVFNNQYISMTEGYVDVETLDLWPENHRIELHVAEFRNINGRDPDRGELLELMHGKIMLPSLDKKNQRDPFSLLPLAGSIARKGVERPPIVTYEGLLKDGNRRIAASLLVLDRDEFSSEEKERARWIRVWRAPKGTTDDQFDAIVVALNFEDDYKIKWEEYVKARLVVKRYELLREQVKGRFTEAKALQMKKEVAKHFAITHQAVTRYLKMVQWADDFEAYHLAAGREQAKVTYKANDIFQWFYEIDAGKAGERLTQSHLDEDDELKSVVFDLMFDVLDSGAQVRALHTVVGDPDALKVLVKAHDLAEDDPDVALDLVKEAIELGKRKSIKRRRVGFEQFLKGVSERLGATPPDQWSYVEKELLLQTRRVLTATIGSINAALEVRAAHGEDVDE